jgi:hypothetical protein
MRIKHAVTYVVASTAVAAASVMLTVAPANAADKSAAIAYSPDDGVFGWSNFMDSEHDAQSRAVFDCVGKGGTSCQVASSISNGCVALAGTETHWSGGTGPSTEAAEHDASAELGGAVHIVFSTCSS